MPGERGELATPGETPSATSRAASGHGGVDEAAYFTNDELPVLFEQFRERGATYRVLFELALKTGMRQGELLALTWRDVDLVHSVIHVRRTYTDRSLGSPKNHEREVFVTEDVVDLLGSWWGECGKPADDKLVLPGDTKTGYMNPQVILRRELYPAMERARIARIGPTGEKRTFHSLRHTFARIAIENNRPIFWLKASRPFVARRDEHCLWPFREGNS